MQVNGKFETSEAKDVAARLVDRVLAKAALQMRSRVLHTKRKGGIMISIPQQDTPEPSAEMFEGPPKKSPDGPGTLYTYMHT